MLNYILKTVRSSSLVALAVAVTSGAAWAQEQAQEDNNGQGPRQTRQNAAQSSEMQELQEAHQRTQSIRNELAAIQEKTLEENPELVRQQEALENLVKKKMKKEGIQPEERIEELQEIRAKIETEQENLGEEERQEMIQEFQQKAQELQAVQQKAMESEQVQKARQAFEDKLIGAMQAKNEKVDALIEELRETQAQMQAMIQRLSAQRQQQMMEAEKQQQENNEENREKAE